MAPSHQVFFLGPLVAWYYPVGIRTMLSVLRIESGQGTSCVGD